MTGSLTGNVSGAIKSAISGIRHKIFYLWRLVLKDADDDFILELAVKCGADIITWNVNDFKRASKFGVSIMTPAEFLRQKGAST